jgi:hypothetical protein
VEKNRPTGHEVPYYVISFTSTLLISRKDKYINA